MSVQSRRAYRAPRSHFTLQTAASRHLQAPCSLSINLWQPALPPQALHSRSCLFCSGRNWRGQEIRVNERWGCEMERVYHNKCKVKVNKQITAQVLWWHVTLTVPGERSRNSRKKTYIRGYYKIYNWKWKASGRLREWLEMSKERKKKRQIKGQPERKVWEREEHNVTGR